ncbi:hypothetical protein ACIQWR_10200 [Streptomyces sp. NPDC098789]|uniref:hypothetical protein n=1 Tax=Streptomyces sp. NPDC098789 TaxID=3366098 RepID=UPI003815E9F4
MSGSDARTGAGGWRAGVRAGSAPVRDGRRIRTLGQWRTVGYKEVAGFKGEYVSWQINRKFRHDDRICVVFEGLRERPCVTLRDASR